MKITKHEMLNIIRGARRKVDTSLGIHVNMKRQIFIDRKKKVNKGFCRQETINNSE